MSRTIRKKSLSGVLNVEGSSRSKSFLRIGGIKTGFSIIAKCVRPSTGKNIEQRMKKNVENIEDAIEKPTKKNAERTQKNIGQSTKKNAENIKRDIGKSIGTKKGHTIEHTKRLKQASGLAEKLILKDGQENKVVVRLKVLTCLCNK